MNYSHLGDNLIVVTQEFLIQMRLEVFLVAWEWVFQVHRVSSSSIHESFINVSVMSTNRRGQKIVWVIEGVNEWDAVRSDLIHQRWQNFLSHQDLVFGDDSRPVVVKDVANAIHAEPGTYPAVLAAARRDAAARREAPVDQEG